jgi:hypothetical protein
VDNSPSRRGLIPSPVPVACDLMSTPGKIEERMAEYRRLFERALLGRENDGESDGRSGIRFRFRADPGIADWVRDLAAREEACCAFFRFTVTQADGEVWWDASVIDDALARRVLDGFLADLAVECLPPDQPGAR